MIKNVALKGLQVKDGGYVRSSKANGATHRNVDFEVLKRLSVELEKVYDDFCATNEEYELLVSNEKFIEHRVVNGDDLKTYNANVKQTYEEARDVYTQSVRMTNPSKI